jgi:hypothetical protein
LFCPECEAKQFIPITDPLSTVQETIIESLQTGHKEGCIWRTFVSQVSSPVITKQQVIDSVGDWSRIQVAQDIIGLSNHAINLILSSLSLDNPKHAALSLLQWKPISNGATCDFCFRSILWGTEPFDVVEEHRYPNGFI